MKNTNERIRSAHVCSAVSAAVLSGLLLAASGCRPQAGKIAVNPPTLEAGRDAAVSVDTSGVRIDATFKWEATRGAFDASNQRLTIFHAPADPGTVVISCTVISGDRQYVKSTVVEVMPKHGGGFAPIDPVAVSKASSSNANQQGAKAATSAAAPVNVTKPLDVGDFYVPSGWMGDAEHGEHCVKVDMACVVKPHSDPTCQRWSCTFSNQGWAAVAWQYPENNWGNIEGLNLSKGGFKKVTFWARGEKGDEAVQFKAGGNTNPSELKAASFSVDLDFVKLSKDWQEFSMSLQGQDLSNVPSAFTWAARATDNADGLIFYLDDIRYE